MDTGWLYDFLALIETGSFTQAATYRHCSQAAFSRRIQNLEIWAGAKLIDRSAYPLKLTKAGEKFRHRTLSLTSALEGARAEVGSSLISNNVRVAITYSLAADSFPKRWASWTKNTDISCTTLVGNVLETTSIFTAGQADLLISYKHPLFPGSELDSDLYDKVVISHDLLRPYATEDFGFPGTKNKPVPLLKYTEHSYFSKVFQHIIDNAEQTLHSRVVMKSEISLTLAKAAEEGLGVAWLTDTYVNSLASTKLIPLHNPANNNLASGRKSGVWHEEMQVVVHKAYANRRPAVKHIWQELTK